MLSLTPRLREPQRARRSTVSTFTHFERVVSEILRYRDVCIFCDVLICVYSVLSDNALKYVPGKSRSHHLQMMMSKEELEEEQRSVKAARTCASF